MKPGFEHLSANLSIMFTEVDFLDRFALAAKAGFNAVECWFPYEYSASVVKQRLLDHGLRLVGLNTAAGDVRGGEWGLAVNPQQVEQFRTSVLQALEYSSVLGNSALHVMAGIVRPEFSAAAQATYENNLAWAAEQAAQIDKTVLIEPLNPIDRPGYLLCRQAQARDIIAALGKPNIKLMFDIYHVQMTEGRVSSHLQAARDLIGHIQLADVPGRHEPGTGELRFDYLFEQIHHSGYFARGGVVGCEYKPSTATAQSLSWIKS